MASQCSKVPSLFRDSIASDSRLYFPPESSVLSLIYTSIWTTYLLCPLPVSSTHVTTTTISALQSIFDNYLEHHASRYQSLLFYGGSDPYSPTTSDDVDWNPMIPCLPHRAIRHRCPTTSANSMLYSIQLYATDFEHSTRISTPLRTMSSLVQSSMCQVNPTRDSKSTPTSITNSSSFDSIVHYEFEHLFYIHIH